MCKEITVFPGDPEGRYDLPRWVLPWYSAWYRSTSNAKGSLQFVANATQEHVLLHDDYAGVLEDEYTVLPPSRYLTISNVVPTPLFVVAQERRRRSWLAFVRADDPLEDLIRWYTYDTSWRDGVPTWFASRAVQPTGAGGEGDA